MNQNNDLSCLFPVMAMLGMLTFTSVEMLAADKESGIAYDYKVQEGVNYGTADGLALSMDIVVPSPKPGRPVPVFILIHGGGWNSGKRQDMMPRAIALAQHGYVGATMDYRLASQAPFPAQLQDVKCAVRFLRANASRFGIDPERIGVWGCSAGGHLAAMAGLTEGIAEFEGNAGNQEISGRVQMVVDCFGPSDFVSWEGAVNKIARDATASAFFGPSIESKNAKWGNDFSLKTDANIKLLFQDKAEEKARWASPLTYVVRKPHIPPFVIVHGTQDAWVPLQQSIRLAEMLDSVGVNVTLMIQPNMGHDDMKVLPEILKKITEIKADPDVMLKVTSTTVPSSLSAEDAKLRHYFVSVGKKGDERYLKNWQGVEVGELAGNKNQTWRWSREESQVKLPVVPGISYHVYFKILTSVHNLSSTSGIYLGEQQMEPLPSKGFHTVCVLIPAQMDDEVILRVLCKTFVPKVVAANSEDTRELGLCLTEIEVQADGAEQLPRYDICNNVYERK
jgi:acetyl esterase/lipase